jgi:hypothetical protein
MGSLRPAKAIKMFFISLTYSQLSRKAGRNKNDSHHQGKSYPRKTNMSLILTEAHEGFVTS